MTQQNNKNIRLMLIQEDDRETLTDDLVNMWFTKAQTITGQSDETALEFYTCYLLAKHWQSLGFVTKIETTTLKEKNPQSYLDDYNQRLDDLADDSAPFYKTSNNPDFEYDEDTGEIKRT